MTDCPVCLHPDCHYWELRRNETWHPVPGVKREWSGVSAVEPGTLMPCGSNPDGSHREFFVHPGDVEGLIRDGITINMHGGVQHYRVSLTTTPFYGNGDVQIVAKLDRGFSPATAEPPTRIATEGRDGLDTGGALKDAA